MKHGRGDAYRGLVELLEQHLSPTTVEATLSSVLTKRGLTADGLDAEGLAALVADAMVGLRMFCAPERIGDLMLDLADYCESHGVE